MTAKLSKAALKANLARVLQDVRGFKAEAQATMDIAYPGPNRLAFMWASQSMKGYLLHETLVLLIRERVVTLDNAGHHTDITARAMNEGIALFNIPYRVSMRNELLGWEHKKIGKWNVISGLTVID